MFPNFDNSTGNKIFHGIGNMNTFDERKKGFEAKFLKDQELQFKIRARRNKYIGQWAAKIVEPKNIEEYQAYKTNVIDFVTARNQRISSTSSTAN